MEGRFNDSCDSDELWEYIGENEEADYEYGYLDFDEKDEKDDTKFIDDTEENLEKNSEDKFENDGYDDEYIDPEIEAFKNDSKFTSLTEYEFFKLNQDFPDCKIKNIKDLAKSDNLNTILNIWRKGIPLSQAYAAANIGVILNKRTAAARQSAINSMNSKSHLTASRSTSKENVFIPNDVMNEYKGFFPDWSEKRIIEDYKKRR